MEAIQLTKDKAKRAAYRVRTERGEFILVRSTLRPEVLYPVNDRLEPCRVQGYRMFTDRGGELRGVR